MKILIIDNSFWTIKNFRQSLVNELHSTHDLNIIAGSDQNIQFFKKEGFNCSGFKFSSKGKNPIQELVYFFKIFYMICKLKPDYILSFTIKPNFYCSIISFILRKKLIVTVTGFGRLFLNSSILNRLLFKMIFRVILLGGRTIVFQNQDDKKFIEDRYQLYNLKERFLVSPGSGVDTFYYDSDLKTSFVPSSDSKNTNRTDVRFLFLGRLFKDKGIHELLEALSMCVEKKLNFHFGFFGDISNDTDGKIIRTKVNELAKIDSSVQYFGFRKNIKAVLDAYDVIVLPSYREGLPKSLIEAASMRLAILASDVPGCREVVEHNQNGYLFQPFSAEAIFDAINKILMLSDNDLRSFGAHSRNIAIKKFDQSNVIKLYNNLIN